MSDNTFDALGIGPELLKALADENIQTPTAIQEQSIAPLLAGRDILAQAQTGSGKTAAFSLPIIQKLNIKGLYPQCLILAPTRELSIQVAKACQSYAKYIKGLEVCTLYGGGEYRTQLKALKDGAQLIVGTPGRVMDHMRRGTLKLDGLKHLVLDEADEMLRMGFLQDVHWILENAPAEKQIALFSATMPKTIKAISEEFLQNPEVITIPSSTLNAPDIDQKYIIAAMAKRAEIIVRLLEFRRGQGVIIFTRTKAQTVELKTLLNDRGFKAEAINSDLKQNDRKRALTSLENSQIDIVVATDVAARGIDIARVACVINYELPFDNESYVHRIGRTGRAGRSGESIVLVNQREERFLKKLERITKSTIDQIKIPSAKSLNTFRKQKFCEDILKASENMNASDYQSVIEELSQTLSHEQMAAAIASLYHQNNPFLIDEANDPLNQRAPAKSRERSRDKREKSGRDRVFDEHMIRFKVSVGKKHGVKPGNIVGAIANEGGISSKSIGQIDIGARHSFVYLPAGLPKKMMKHLQKTRVCGVELNLTVAA